jgi:hypothetical protein
VTSELIQYVSLALAVAIVVALIFRRRGRSK